MVFEALAGEIALTADTSGADEATDAIGGLEDAAMSASGAAAAAGTALAGAAAGGIAAATKSAADFEAQMADVEKVTSAETAKELEGRFMSLAETIPLPREELVKLGEQAGKFGAEGPKEIEKFVETVGQIQTATDMAAQEAGTRFAKIAGAVGMPLDQIGKLGNATNALADSMKTDANEISDTANRTANILSQQLGMGEDAVLALSASMNEVSPSAEKAAGALTSASEAMLDPNKIGDIASALGMTEQEFRNMRESDPQGLMQKIATSMDEGGKSADALRSAVGSRASRAFAKLGSQMDRTQQAQQTVNEQFENGTSLANEMAIRTDTAAGQWQLFKNKVENAATSIGQQFLPIAKTLLGVLNEAASWFSELNQRTSGFAGAAALVAGLVTGLVTAIGGLVGVLSSSTAAMAGLSGSVAALSTAMSVLLGPIGLLIAGIAALAVAWQRDFMGMREVTANVLGAIQDQLAAAGDAFTALVDTVRTAGELIVAALTGTWGLAETVTLMKLKQDVRAAVEEGLASIVQTFDTLQQRIPPALARALDAAVAWLTGTGIPRLIQAFKQLATLAAQAFELLATELPPLLQQAITAAVEWLLTTGVPLAMDGFAALVDAATQIVETLVDLLPPAIQRGVTALVNWLQASGIPLAMQAFQTLVDTVVQVVGLLEQHLPPLINRAVTALINWLRTSGIPLAKGAFGLLVDAAVTILTTLADKLPPLVDAAIRAAIDWVRSTGIPLAKQGFQLLIDGIVTVLGLLAEKLPPLIKAGVTAMLAWVRQNGPGLAKQAFKLLGQAIRFALENFLAVGGILIGLFKDFIGFVVDYLKNQAADDLKTAADLAAQGLVAGIELAIQAVTPPDGLIVQMIAAIVDYLKNDAWGDLKAAAEFLFDVIYAAAEGLYEGLIGGSLIPEMFQAIVAYIRDTAVGLIEDAIKQVVDGIIWQFENLYNLLIRGGGIVVNLIADILAAFETFGTDLLEWLGGMVGDFITAVTDWANDVILGEGSLINRLVDTAFETFETFGGDLLEWLGNFIDDFISDVETFADDLIFGDNSIVNRLVEAIQDAFDAMKEAIVGEGGIIPKLADKAKEIFENLGGALATLFKDAFNNAVPGSVPIPKVTINNPLGDDVTIGGGELDLPQLDTGGFIEEDGLAMLHAGEEVVPAAEVDRRGGGGGGGGGDTFNIDITVEEAQDMDERQLARRIKELLENANERAVRQAAPGTKLS